MTVEKLKNGIDKFLDFDLAFAGQIKTNPDC